MFQILFAQKPQICISADTRGIEVKIHGDAAALAFMLGLEMVRSPEMKKLFEVALESVNNPELADAYQSVADNMIRTDNN